METGEPVENSRTHGENMQPPNRDRSYIKSVLKQILNSFPSLISVFANISDKNPKRMQKNQERTLDLSQPKSKAHSSGSGSVTVCLT